MFDPGLLPGLGTTVVHAHDTIEPHTAWWQAWNADPLLILGVSIAGLIYARGLRRWQHRARVHPRWRVASYYGGLVTLLLLFESPLDRLGEHQFSFHMVQHNLVMMLVPPLLLLGAPTTPMLRGMPRVIRRGVIRRVIGSPVGRWVFRTLTHPIVAIAIFTLSQWAWHLMPGWYDTALRNDTVHWLQHTTFLGVSMLFWWNIIDPKPLRSRVPMIARIPYFYGAMIPKHILAAMITFADQPFYPTYTHVYQYLPLTPLEDQQLAGLLMWVPFGEMLNLLIVGIIFSMWWRRGQVEQRRREAQEDERRDLDRQRQQSGVTPT